MGAVTPSILAVDPGPRMSAYVELAGDRIVAHGKVGNIELLQKLRTTEPHGPLVVEMIAPYGKSVGREVFETCTWIGRYLEAWRGVGRLLERKEVKKALGLQVGHRGSTDADVRRMLIARWSRKLAVPESGKAEQWAIGTKRAPGPLFGIVADQWAALAVAVAWRETHAEAFAAVEAAP